MERGSFRFILPLFFAAFLLLPSIRATKVQYCDKEADYAVKVSGIDISPNPVVGGKPATFSIFASTEEAISGGKLVIEVYFWGLHVHTESDDLCTKTSCPVSTGDFTITHSESLPGFTPPGSYKLRMKMVDGSGKQLTCIGFSFRIGSASLVSDN